MFRKGLLLIIMRLFILLFFTTVFAITPNNIVSQNSKIKINEDKALTVDEVFRLIKKQTEYRFFYEAGLFKDYPKVNVKKGIVNTNDLLNKTLSKGNLIISITDNKNILIKERILTTVNQNQEYQVTGTIVDSNNQPLPGANIIEKGTTNGTQSDFDGRFSIKVLDKNAILVISYVGFSSQEIEVGNQSEIDIVLEEDADQLDEVVVVGYGVQKKSDLTGSVASVSTQRLEDKPNTNFTQALQGALPGINVTTNSSGAEQNDVTLLIRGRNSIKASNSPLIIYDGVPYNGSLSDINTSDIKSMTVLKDASSTAIYGSRGANGVILIETKKGKLGKPKISYSTYYAINEIANIPPVYSGQGFAAFKETREPGEFTASEIQKLIDGESTNWLDLATRTGSKLEHSLSVSGATDKVNYYVSSTIFDSKGVAKNDNFQRISLRLNLSFDVTDNIKFGTNTQLSRIDRSGLSPSFGSEAAGAYFTNPLTDAFDDDGNLTVFPWPEEPFFENPLAPTLAVNDNINNQIFTNNYLEFKFPFLEGLSYRISTGVEFSTRNQETYWGLDTARGFSSNGESDVRNQVDENYLIENILNYNKVFGEHSIAFTGLYSSQKVKFKENRTQAAGFPSDLLTFYQPQLALGVFPSTTFSQTTLISQMGRLNYSYGSKYLATLTVRRDGFSGFGRDKKYGVFPSAALAWKLSEESFFKKGFVNSTKLRVSYGENGNQAVGPYDNLARLNDRSYLNGETTSPGFVPDQLANNELSWETTATFNAGVDFGFLKERIQLSLDVYQARTRNLLLDRLIPSVHGITEITQNVGKTKNQGFELGLKATILNSSDFNWNMSGNMSYNKNEIVSLFGQNQDDVGNELFIGQPIRVNYGLVFNGIWQQGDDISNSAQTNAFPGDVRVLDIDNPLDENGLPILGISNDLDRAIQGQRDPKMTWGLENTFNYKNFSLYIFMHGVTGVTKRNTIRDENVFLGVRRNWFVLDYWTPENPINTYHRNDPNANIFNVGFYENADFIRIKDITLTYKLGEKIFGSSSNGLKLFATARNLFTITNWDGLDPELASQRSIPLQKEFVLGLNLNF